MTDAIVQWLLSAGEGKFLATVLISMLPVIELRGGLPAGVAMGLPLREAFFAALLGNLLPVPFIILFARRGFAWVRAHIPRLGRWVDRIERKAWSKSDKVVRYQAWGLLLFVAVPLPGTGAWTGALIAALLNAALAVQFAVFLIVSALALVATRPLVKKLRAGKPVPTNLDRVIGASGRVTETVDNSIASGAVYVDRPQRGRLHPAQGADGPDRKNGGRKALC